MTGFNWSDVPTIIPELGFLSNAEEDRLMATDAYRTKIADGLAGGIIQYLQGR
jgi:N-acetylmuramoyl-L-alanine amidase